MILGHKHIKEAIDSGRWLVHRDGVRIGSDKLTIGSNSINLSFGNKLLVGNVNWPEYTHVDPHDPNSVLWSEVPPLDGKFLYTPGLFGLMHGRERFHCSAPLTIDGKETFFIPMLETRSTYARLGVSSHLNAGFGDFGFHSSWTLEVTAALPIILREKDEVAQISFTSSSDGSHFYDGVYNEQNDAPLPPILGKNRFQRWD